MSFVFSSLIIVILFLFILNIVTSIWAYRDCLQRGKSQEYAIIVLFGTLFFPVMGMIVYLIIRND